jgi:hypothetical protein
MKKHLIISLLVVGLLGSSLVHAQANPASAACQKLKKEGLADELKRKKFYQAYAPAMGKPKETFTQKQFDLSYSRFRALIEHNLIVFGKLQKSPQCFSKEQFKLIENNITMYSGFYSVATKEWISKYPKPFIKIVWESVYGTKL